MLKFVKVTFFICLFIVTTYVYMHTLDLKIVYDEKNYINDLKQIIKDKRLLINGFDFSLYNELDKPSIGYEIPFAKASKEKWKEYYINKIANDKPDYILDIVGYRGFYDEEDELKFEAIIGKDPFYANEDELGQESINKKYLSNTYKLVNCDHYFLYKFHE